MCISIENKGVLEFYMLKKSMITFFIMLTFLWQMSHKCVGCCRFNGTMNSKIYYFS